MPTARAGRAAAPRARQPSGRVSVSIRQDSAIARRRTAQDGVGVADVDGQEHRAPLPTSTGTLSISRGGSKPGGDGRTAGPESSSERRRRFRIVDELQVVDAVSAPRARRRSGPRAGSVEHGTANRQRRRRRRPTSAAQERRDNPFGRGKIHVAAGQREPVAARTVGHRHDLDRVRNRTPCGGSAASCCASFSPKSAMSGRVRLNSLSTTVSTPRKSRAGSRPRGSRRPAGVDHHRLSSG